MKKGERKPEDVLADIARLRPRIRRSKRTLDALYAEQNALYIEGYRAGGAGEGSFDGRGRRWRGLRGEGKGQDGREEEGGNGFGGGARGESQEERLRVGWRLRHGASDASCGSFRL